MHSYLLAHLLSLPFKYLDRNHWVKRQDTDKLRSRLAHGHHDSSHHKTIAISNSPPSLWNNLKYQRAFRLPGVVWSIMASSKPQFNHPALGVPPTPQSPRALRRFQSHQHLSSNSPSLITQQRQQLHRNANTIGIRGNLDEPSQNERPTQTAAGTMPSHGRSRSNSDLAISNRSSLPGPRQSGSARKFRPSLGSSRRSALDNLLRDGPSNGTMEEGLQELRYLVLSNRVDSDSDGMVRSSSQCFEKCSFILCAY